MTELTLDIPEQTDFIESPEQRDPKKIQQWIGSLPSTDPERSARLLSDALSELNAHMMPAARRYELLDMYSKPITGLDAEADSYFVASLPPLSTSKKNTLSEIDRFYSELAQGYKAIVVGTVASWIDWEKEWVYGASIYNALSLLVQRLVNDYRQYRAPQGSAWREIHQLYNYAKSHSVHERAFFRQYGDDSPLKSVSHLYKYALMLELCDPYHLSHDEFRVASTYVANFSRHAIIRDYREPEESRDGKFLIKTASSVGPLRFVPHSLVDDSVWRILDVSPLLSRVDQHRHALRHAEQEAIQTRHGDHIRRDQLPLLDRLSEVWRCNRYRHEERVYMAGNLELAAGVRGVHFAVNGMEVFSDEEEDNLGREDSFIEHLRDAGTLMDIKLSLYQTEVWPRINQSKGGLAVLRTADKKNKIPVGQLIAVSDDRENITDRRSWILGVVRRLNEKKHGNVAIGIQYLSSNIEPLAIKPIHTSVSDATYTPSLLIRDHSYPRPDPVLIADVALYRPHEPMKLLRNDEELTIVATELAEQRDGFVAFYFSYKPSPTLR